MLLIILNVKVSGLLKSRLIGPGIMFPDIVLYRLISSGCRDLAGELVSCSLARRKCELCMLKMEYLSFWKAPWNP